MSTAVAAILATTLLQVMTSILWQGVPVLATSIAAGTGLAASQAGVYASAIFVGAMLTAPMSGPLIPRFGGFRLNQVAVVIGGIGFVLALGGTWWALLLSALIVGAGYGPGAPAASHLLAKRTPPGWRSLIFSVKQSGVPVGGVIAGLVLPPIAEAAGWQAAVLAGAAIVLATCAVLEPLRRRLDDDRPPRAQVPPFDMQAVRRGLWPVAGLRLHADLKHVAFAGFVAAALQGCAFAFMTTYLQHSLGTSLIAAGAIYATMQGFGFVGRIANGYVADKLVPAQALLALLAFTGAVATLALAALTPAWPIAAAYAVAAVAGVSIAGWNGVYLAEIARLAPPGKVGDATGACLFFTFFGYVVGPLSASAVIGATGSFAAAFLIFGALAFVSALVLALRALRRSPLPDALK